MVKSHGAGHDELSEVEILQMERVYIVVCKVMHRRRLVTLAKEARKYRHCNAGVVESLFHSVCLKFWLFAFSFSCGGRDINVWKSAVECAQAGRLVVPVCTWTGPGGTIQEKMRVHIYIP